MGLSGTLATLYHTYSGQCIMGIGANKANLQTLQSMIARSVFGFSHREDWGAGLIPDIGAIVRIAMRLGLHRDPSHFSNMTPFQGEMRRRIWITISQIDVLSSFHLGMPAAIRMGDCDTEDPRNLLDTDLEETISELPPSRPFSQNVPLGYMLIKNNILGVMRRVVEFLNSIHTEPYERVLQLDKGLVQVYAMIPSYLRLNNWENTHKDPPYLVLQKVQLDTLYHQTVSVLHRRYLRKARTDSKFALSEQRCVDSSMVLLKHQSSIYREAQPGGCLSSIYGYTIAPESVNFTLAAMVLCLYLQDRTRIKRRKLLHANTKDQEILRALDTSHAIWKDLSDKHHEAGKVAHVLEKMLELLRPRISLHDRLSVLEPGAAFNCEESTSISAQSTIISEPGFYINTNFTESANMEMNDFNWDAWDSFVQDDNFETAYLGFIDQESSLQAGGPLGSGISPSAEMFTTPCATSEPWDQQPESMLQPQLGAFPLQHISESFHPSP
ncbi:putative fungal-specific transcription factor [Talaromyces proteolyticus]|uniref:Fungal-specific transcription factor n=1 Tax=Talaromyces proteolyticus TaxID=1131652 RepID=A0AAD4PV24_9EURO|nr:putative fungal-specific transcription factor [Talaromyces proteolyticus]KAH8690131.1 putative fungal-specific transcription factor [Talaromyces proteolyticus]